jgi:hypothetical protein
MIADSFDSRTLANMEVVLERACKILSKGAEEHELRRYSASKILECAKGGDKTLGGLTEAGRAAASELSALDQPNLALGAILPDMRDWVTRA